MDVVHGARELWDWLHAIDAQFAFLLALPLVVAIAAFLGDWVRSYPGRKKGQHPLF